MTIWDSIVGWGCVSVALLWLLLAGLIHGRAAHRRAPQNAARPAASPAQPAVRAHREDCTVPFCTATVVMHISAGFDRWPFCLTHGMPYLVDEDVAA